MSSRRQHSIETCSGFMWDFGDQSYAVVWRDNSAIHFVRDDASPKGVQLMLNTAYKEGTRPPEPVRVHGHSDIGLFFSGPDLDATYAYLRSQGI